MPAEPVHQQSSVPPFREQPYLVQPLPVPHRHDSLQRRSEVVRVHQRKYAPVCGRQDRPDVVLLRQAHPRAVQEGCSVLRRQIEVAHQVLENAAAELDQVVPADPLQLQSVRQDHQVCNHAIVDSTATIPAAARPAAAVGDAAAAAWPAAADDGLAHRPGGDGQPILLHCARLVPSPAEAPARNVQRPWLELSCDDLTEFRLVPPLVCLLDQRDLLVLPRDQHLEHRLCPARVHLAVTLERLTQREHVLAGGDTLEEELCWRQAEDAALVEDWAIGLLLFCSEIFVDQPAVVSCVALAEQNELVRVPRRDDLHQAALLPARARRAGDERLDRDAVFVSDVGRDVVALVPVPAEQVQDQLPQQRRQVLLVEALHPLHKIPLMPDREEPDQLLLVGVGHPAQPPDQHPLVAVLRDAGDCVVELVGRGEEGHRRELFRPREAGHRGGDKVVAGVGGQLVEDQVLVGCAAVLQGVRIAHPDQVCMAGQHRHPNHCLIVGPTFRPALGRAVQRVRILCRVGGRVGAPDTFEHRLQQQQHGSVADRGERRPERPAETFLEVRAEHHDLGVGVPDDQRGDRRHRRRRRVANGEQRVQPVQLPGERDLVLCCRREQLLDRPDEHRVGARQPGQVVTRRPAVGLHIQQADGLEVGRGAVDHDRRYGLVAAVRLD